MVSMHNRHILQALGRAGLAASDGRPTDGRPTDDRPIDIFREEPNIRVCSNWS
jgi:hypothetical protein